jgi:hypothetical protein
LTGYSVHDILRSGVGVPTEESDSPVWEVEYTDEFRFWWEALTVDQQVAVTARVELLEQHGPSLGRPTVGEIEGSRIGNLKELRVARTGTFGFCLPSTGAAPQCC